MPKRLPRHPLSARDRVIDAMRAMTEADLRTKVVIPLFSAMGATHVVHVHGSQERGKDIIYVMPDRLDDPILGVIQVKNAALTGSFTSGSSAGSSLQQLLHCRETEVLNPNTHKKELPREVVFVTTYDLPDAALADSGPLLIKVQTYCKIVGPVKLAQLVERHLNHLFNDLAFPGTDLSRAIAAYVSTHREAHAFELSFERTLESFYVRLNLALCGTVLSALAHGTLRILKPRVLTCDYLDFSSLKAIYDLIPEVHTIPPLITSTVRKRQVGRKRTVSKVVSERPPRDLRLAPIDVAHFLTCLSRYVSSSSSRVRRGSQSLIDIIQIAADLLGVLNVQFPSGVFGAAAGSPGTVDLVLSNVAPESILNAKTPIAIIADAGSGKTSLARRLTDAATLQTTPCLYFPCSRIQSRDATLKKSIWSFLVSIGAIDAEADIASILRSSKVIVIDGCDEAATFGPVLGKQIMELLPLPEPERIAGKGRYDHYSTDPLDGVIVVEMAHDGKSALVSLTRPITRAEFAQLKALNQDNLVGPAIERIERRFLEDAPLLVITTRDIDALSLAPVFAEVRLLPFTEDQMYEFFAKWFKADKSKSEQIRAFLLKNSHIREVCTNPMTATIVASLHENDFPLPNSRAEVYERRFDLLLERWDRHRAVKRLRRISKLDKRNFLRRLALTLHVKHRRRFSSTFAGVVWERTCGARYPDLTIHDVLNEIRVSDSLIVPDGRDEYSLGHLSFQEYLTAEAIVYGQRLKSLASNFYDPWWRNVLLFYAGIASDLASLLACVQKNHPLEENDGLLSEMMQEAQYTTGLVPQLVTELERESSSDDTESDVADIPH